jgi:hypothetical protein
VLMGLSGGTGLSWGVRRIRDADCFHVVRYCAAVRLPFKPGGGTVLPVPAEDGFAVTARPASWR